MDQSFVQDRTDRLGAFGANGLGVLAAILAGLAALVLLFLPETRAAIDVWNASTAYSHCYLVLPMTLYLLWDRRDVIRASLAEPRPGLALLALPLAVVWLVAERLGIMEGRQLAAIACVQLLFMVVLGLRFYWRVSGPLLFLFFLVPFGAFLTPALQRFTAGFTVIGLELFGIPHYADNFIIETPAGTFFVAEACAGLRFLIAAIAFGVFYALLSYRTVSRRAAFILASIVVPIIANGFRALGIVVLGQVLGSAEAAAADHIVYGWVFFSAVMLMLVAGGQLIRESGGAGEPIARPSGAALPGRALIWSGAVAVIALMGTGPAIAALIDSRATVPTLRDTPLVAVPAGCEKRVAPGEGSGGNRRFVLDCGGERFDVDVAVFPARSTSSAMVSLRRQVTHEIGAEDATVARVDAPATAGAWTLVQTTDPNRVTAFASWVDGLPVRSGLSGRIAQARDSLTGADHVPVLVTISMAEPAQSLPAVRRGRMESLRAIIMAQPGLDARVAEMSQVSATRP